MTEEQFSFFFIEGDISKLIANDQVELFKPVFHYPQIFLRMAFAQLCQKVGYGSK